MKKIKRVFLSFVFIVVFLCQTQSVMACTIFTVIIEDGTILACNNEDWMYSISNTVIISAADSENYGRVCFYNSSYVQGGMNEYGLFYDGASCPSTPVPYDNNKKDLGYDLGETVLARCKTVKEVEEFFSDYNIPGSFCDHLLFADALGNAAVFEWVEDEFRIIPKDTKKNYQTITNFWLSNPSLGGYPCSRYNTVEEALSKEEATLELCERILSNTRQDWGNGGTLYSNICNLTEREVYLYYRGDYEQAYQIDLLDELTEMSPGSCRIMNMEELYREDIQEIIEPEYVEESIEESVNEQGIFYYALWIWELVWDKVKSIVSHFR